MPPPRKRETGKRHKRFPDEFSNPSFYQNHPTHGGFNANEGTESRRLFKLSEPTFEIRPSPDSDVAEVIGRGKVSMWRGRFNDGGASHDLGNRGAWPKPKRSPKGRSVVTGGRFALASSDQLSGGTRFLQFGNLAVWRLIST